MLLAQIDDVVKKLPLIKPQFNATEFQRIRAGVQTGIDADTSIALRLAVLQGNIDLQLAMAEALK